MIRHGKGSDQAGKLTPFLMWDFQREMCRRIFAFLRTAEAESRTKVLEWTKSRELGITATAMLPVFWLWAFRRGDSLVSSRTGSSVNQKGNPNALTSILARLWSYTPQHLQPRATHTSSPAALLFNLDTKAAIIGQKATEDSMRGDRGLLVVIDEFMALSPRLQRALIESSNTTGHVVILIGQPSRHGASGPAYELFNSLPREQVEELDWRVRPDRAGRHVEDKYATHDETGALTYFGAQLAVNGGSYTLAVAQRELACRWDVTVEGAVWSWRREKVVYTEDDPDFRALGTDARVKLPLLLSGDFGIGSTYGTSFLVWLLEVLWKPHAGCEGRGCKQCKGGHWPAGLRMWMDREQVRTRTAAAQVGAEIRETLRTDYGRWQKGAGPVIYGMDPAGVQEDSELRSWEKNLRPYLPNFRCMDGAWNTSPARSGGRDDVQYAFDAPGGLLRVHESCRTALAAFQQWRWNIPEGSQPEDFDQVNPEKSKWSHLGDAATYGVQRAQKYLIDLRLSCSGIGETKTKGPGALKRIDALRTDYRRAMGGR